QFRSPMVNLCLMEENNINLHTVRVMMHDFYRYYLDASFITSHEACMEEATGIHVRTNTGQMPLNQSQPCQSPDVSLHGIRSCQSTLMTMGKLRLHGNLIKDYRVDCIIR